jgi:hypothetical protein
LNIDSSNVSWTTQLIFSVNVTSGVPPDSWMNITAGFSMNGEYKNVTLARFKTLPITDFFVIPKGTSLMETPAYELTMDEEVFYGITVNIPSITTDLVLTITLPALGGQTPMEWSHTGVAQMGAGVISERLHTGVSGQLYVGDNYRSSFQSILNVVKFDFGKTSNLKPNQNGSVSIGLEMTAKVLSNEPFRPGSTGNISFELAYRTINGIRRIGPIYKPLNLSEPPLLCMLEVVNGQPSYQGNDIVKYDFHIKNPSFSTQVAEAVTVAILLKDDLVRVKNISARLCSELHCDPVHFSNLSILNITISR